MARDNNPKDDEAQLWARTAADVQPLKGARRNIERSAPVAKASMRAADDARVMQDALSDEIDPAELDSGDEASFRRPGIQISIIRRLRRGQFHVQDELDLHGHTRKAAAAQLKLFLDEARDHDYRCVRIIHGKGLRSPRGEPVLKARVEISLQRRDDVLAYASAPPWLGGHGAVLVLLRRASA